jgi:hypothetical protein
MLTRGTQASYGLVEFLRRGSATVVKFMLAIALLAGAGVAYASETPDIEIWLGERKGRFGDFEFEALGGRPTYPSPTGAFAVQWKSRLWWSKQWNAQMPYSLFFKDGCAIHAGSLRTMSHGCIHVTDSVARYLFNASKEGQTRVFVYP